MALALKGEMVKGLAVRPQCGLLLCGRLRPSVLGVHMSHVASCRHVACLVTGGLRLRAAAGLFFLFRVLGLDTWML
jgi:hypothetical protein